MMFVFVTVVLLCVAGYFLWEALRDMKNADARRLASSAHRIAEPANADDSHSTANKTSSAAEAAQQSGAGTTPTAATHPNSGATRKTPSDKPAANRQPAPSLHMKQAPANDSNVSAATGAAVAGASAAIAAGVAGKQHAANQSQGNTTSASHFLERPIGRKDNLTRIDGVGPVVEEGLNNIGIFHFHQIANFTDTDIRNVDAALEFPGRITRENWVEQARKLSSISVDQTSLVSTNDQLDSVVSIDEHASHFGDTDSVLTESDYTGVWNTDVLIEVQERLKVLNTRVSDAPRLRVTQDEYNAIKSGEDSEFSRDRLVEILDRLRALDEL